MASARPQNRRVARGVSVVAAAGLLLLLVGGLPAHATVPFPDLGGPAAAQGAPEATPDPCPAPTPIVTPGPGETPPPAPEVTPYPNLCPAPAPGSARFDPLLGLFAWLFTPVFQALFLVLAGFYALVGDIGLAIVLLTIALRLLLVPLFRTQIVSTRRMQILQPELRALQSRHKGDRARISQEQMRLYRERGVNPAAGCLPAILQLALLLPMFYVIREGLQAPIIDPMLHVLGAQVLDVACHAPGDALAACINPVVHWLFDLDAAHPEVIFWIQKDPAKAEGFGLSILALVSAVLQLVQTRMVTPQTNDPQQRRQQQMFIFLPLISLVYGGFLPAGLFIYWIVTTVFSIAQQYLIVGWGSLFPLFGWTPAFAVDHTPRFPVAQAPGGGASLSPSPAIPPRGSSPLDRAAGTVRPSKQRGRTSRRGRRR